MKFLDKILNRFRRRNHAEPLTIEGYNGVLLRKGMRVRSARGSETTQVITRILPKYGEIELEYEDGKRTVVHARNYVPVRRRRR